jgi:hypothetical protein
MRRKLVTEETSNKPACEDFEAIAKALKELEVENLKALEAAEIETKCSLCGGSGRVSYAYGSLPCPKCGVTKVGDMTGE